ncbi:hypothetical protein OAV68_02625 [bacterium]|nr:hypothetical protein [Paracoccaceae bacterium]MDC3309775.1 hypothetical protein [bacterium]
MYGFFGLGKFNNVNAAGQITKRAERLEEIRIDGAEGFSVSEIDLETGTFYRLRITSDGKDEYFFSAPNFFNSIWFDQIVINDLEIKPTGIYGLEFDDKGSIDLFFVPIKTGKFKFSIPALEHSGFVGQITVR